MRTVERRLPGCLLIALLVLAAAGCASLPVNGQVHRVAADRPGNQPEAAYFNPPGPARDASPAAIVSGFLVAMQANPLSTSVARSFLSERAKSAWKPNRGTVVYEAVTVEPNARGAEVRLTDTRRLDPRGGWKGGRPGTETLDVHLVSENGQWRIDNPVDALVVPTSYFERSFARFNLYFFDQTGQVLLPDPVFIPRGAQTATNLVRGLLAGPGSTLGQVVRSAVPGGTTLDLSVVVTESGIAEVPLSREALRAGPAEVTRMVDQLAWTLRQVPGVERVRLTVAGAPLPLPDGRTDVPVSVGAQFDAGRSSDGTTLWGLRGGRVVDLGTPSSSPAADPQDKTTPALRSLAVGDAPRRIAGVTANGGAVVATPPDAPPDKLRLRSVFTGGTDVLRPAYDMFEDLWLLDRTPDGARVYVVRGKRAKEVQVPGVTGTNVSAFAISRDGSRLAVAYAGRPTPVLRVVNVLRTDEGVVIGTGRHRSVVPALADDAEVVDVGWREPSTLAVLSRRGADASQVTFVSADGSPTAPTLIEPSIFRGNARALVVAPDPAVPLRVLTANQRLYTLSGSGQWPLTAAKVTAATYGH